MFRRKSKSNQLIGYHNFQIFFSVCAQGYTVLFIQLAWVSAFCFDMHIRFIGIYRRNRSYAVLVFDVQIFFLFCIYEKVIVEHFLSRISYILLIRELCTKYIYAYINICTNRKPWQIKINSLTYIIHITILICAICTTSRIEITIFKRFLWLKRLSQK